ncbi:hemin ABC transporter substrate-binding protein [uncultured Enterovirga sp.]|uniref:heme/hemin ABC transporter substrate-binding protein n=1 Tax=uncultured Enterovirga sp. TaxID=2026352 RepID=UPI0035CCA366
MLGMLVAAPLGSKAAELREPPPARIVSLGGAVTEILYDLGAGDRVVALDTTSIHPPEALRTKPNVGYLRQLSAEGILSARPDLVLAIEGAGPPDILRIVREAGVPVTVVPDQPTESGVAARIETVAGAIGRGEAGRLLADRTAQHFAALAVARGKVARKIRALFILSLQGGRTMVGGRNTTADGMLALAGAENAAAGIDGYKAMTDEAIVAARPDVVVMLSVGPGGSPPAGLFDGPALSQVPAARERRLVAMDGLYLLGFGPRTPEAARDLMRAFHPGLREE